MTRNHQIPPNAWSAKFALPNRCLLALLLVPALAPSVALAAPPETVAPAPETNGLVPTEVEALRAGGRAMFQAREFVQALLLWNRAYGLLLPGPDTREIMTSLAVDISHAHEQAYAIDHNPAHLEEAIWLLGRRRLEVGELFGYQHPTTALEFDQIDARLATLAQLLESASSDARSPLPAGAALPHDVPPTAIPQPAAPPRPVPPPPPPPPRASASDRPTFENPGLSLEERVAAHPTYGTKFRAGKGLVVGGAVALGIGGGMAVISLTCAGIAAGFGGSGFFATIFGATAAGGFIVGGSLVGAGKKKKNDAIFNYRGRARLGVVPLITPSTQGAGLILRF